MGGREGGGEVGGVGVEGGGGGGGFEEEDWGRHGRWGLVGLWVRRWWRGGGGWVRGIVIYVSRGYITGL